MEYNIFTLCSANYRDAYEFVIDTWLQTKAKHLYIYTDDRNWRATTPRVKIIPYFDLSDDWLVNVGRRVLCLEDLSRREQNSNLLFLDIDCYVLTDLGHVFDMDYDLSVVRFEPGKIVSAGVYFAKNTLDVKRFAADWKTAQEHFKRKRKGVVAHQGSYSQYAYDKVVRQYHDEGVCKIGKLSFDEYSLKIKDVYKHRRYLLNRGIDPNKAKQQTLKRVADERTKVLHFYNNSYRNKRLVKEVMECLIGKGDHGMSEMNVCVAAVVDRHYQKYIPMFVYFCRVSYPSYGIRIFLTDTLNPTYRAICDDLAREGDVKYIENMFRGYPKFNQELKSLRWLVGPAHFQGFDYIYMGDIDILICKEDPPLHLQHITHSNKYNIPYSNSVRPNSKRLSGLHFIIKERYFQSTQPVIKKYAALLKNGKLKAVKNENLLYNIIRESKLPLPPGWFRPHHGIHLGVWRKQNVRISEEKWNTMGRNEYVKYYKYFLSVAANEQYKKVYAAAPLKEITRMRTHLSAELLSADGNA